MSKANSARYTVTCRICGAAPGEPCRTRATGRVTDAHNDRIWLQYETNRRAKWIEDHT